MSETFDSLGIRGYNAPKWLSISGFPQAVATGYTVLKGGKGPQRNGTSPRRDESRIVGGGWSWVGVTNTRPRRRQEHHEK